MRNFADLVNVFLALIAGLVPLIFAVTLLVLVWKIVQLWIINPGDAGKIAEGKQVVVVGVLVLVVMSGVWGIVALLRSSLFW